MPLRSAIANHDRPPARVGGYGRWLIRALLVGAAILTGVFLSACQPDGPLTRIDPVQDIVATEVPRKPDEVAARLVLWFGDGADTSNDAPQNQFPVNDRLSHYQALRFSDRKPDIRGLIPSDFELDISSTNNPALQAYLRLNDQQRANDIYLSQLFHEYYWPSEYVLRERTLPFQSQFIVHLQAVGPERTRIEIIEALPRVNAGEKWGMGGHGEILPGKVTDIREVPPTTRDRLELLEIITQRISEPGTFDQ